MDYAGISQGEPISRPLFAERVMTVAVNYVEWNRYRVLAMGCVILVNNG